MCDCIEKFEQKAAEDMAAKIGQIKNAEITDAPEFENKVWPLVDNNFRPLRVASILKGKYTIGKASRTYSVTVLFTYCPFCGVKL